MKKHFRRRILPALLAIVMITAVMPSGLLTANAGNVEFIDFALTNDSDVMFAGSGGGFQRVTLGADGRPSTIPNLMRTDSLDYVFDGWYYNGEKVTDETVFDEYAIVYDKWSQVTYDSNKIVSSLSLDPVRPTVGMTQSTYRSACGEVSQSGLWVNNAENFTLYDGLHAKNGNELTGAVEPNKDYSVKIIVRVDYNGGYRIGRDLIANVSASNGIVSDVAFVGSNGATTPYWTTDVRMVSVVINFANNDFKTYPTSRSVSNGQEVSVSFETTYIYAKAILQQKTAFGTWNDLYMSKNASSNEFVLPAFSDTTATFRIYVAFPDETVKVGEEFTIVYGSGSTDEDGKFIIQPPVSVDLALGEDYTVRYMFNRAFDNMWVDMWKGYWAERVQFHDNGLSIITGRDYATSISYRIAISYTYEGEQYIKYSDMFTLNWIDEATSWTVSFMANGGTGTMADILNVSGDFVVPECEFTAPAGKKFDMWVSDGIRYNPGDHIDITRAKLFVALWEADTESTYDVLFNANGGTGAMMNETDQLGGYILPECGFTAPAGKQFKCWAEGSVSGTRYEVGEEYDVTGNVTFYAIWEDVTEYIVVYAPGSGGEGSNEIWYEQEGAQITLDTPDDVWITPSFGMEFAYWSIRHDGAMGEELAQKQPGETVIITADTYIIAVWAPAAGRMGDVNGDARITNADILRIYRYIYNAALYPLDTEVADVDGSGEVSNGDILKLYQYIYSPEEYPLD